MKDASQFNCRGTKKWSAMMLPEHLVKIREWKKESHASTRKTLTDWELDDLQQTIDSAFTQQKIVTITVWQNTKYVQFTGTITTMHFETQQLILETITSVKRIPVQDIYSARIEDECYD